MNEPLFEKAEKLRFIEAELMDDVNYYDLKELLQQDMEQLKQKGALPDQYIFRDQQTGCYRLCAAGNTPAKAAEMLTLMGTVCSELGLEEMRVELQGEPDYLDKIVQRVHTYAFEHAQQSTEAAPEFFFRIRIEDQKICEGRWNRAGDGLEVELDPLALMRAMERLGEAFPQQDRWLIWVASQEEQAEPMAFHLAQALRMEGYRVKQLYGAQSEKPAQAKLGCLVRCQPDGQAAEGALVELTGISEQEQGMFQISPEQDGCSEVVKAINEEYLASTTGGASHYWIEDGMYLADELELF